ncbi:MAG: sugar-binding protein [Candidatus Poribacteria bacterium]
MMKRIFTFIGVLAMVSAMALPCMAGKPHKHPKTGEPLVIDCLKGTPKAIDGKLNDWMLNHMTPAVLDTKEQIFPGVAPAAAGWNGPNDSSGKFYLLWDDKNIYLGVVMKDDKLVITQAGGNIWRTDCIEIFFGTTNAVGGHAEHYQYGFTANDQRWNWCNMDGVGQREPDYLEIKSTKTGDGYICEAAIEYAQMKSLDFKAGNAIGFHPVFDDADDGQRKLQMTWTGLEAHDQSQGFGQIILSDESAAVKAIGKAVETWGAIKTLR